MIKINHWTRDKIIIEDKLVFAGGYPKYHKLPKFIKWGNRKSIFWLDTELVIIGGKMKFYKNEPARKGNYICPECGRKVFGFWVRKTTVFWIIKQITCGFCGSPLK